MKRKIKKIFALKPKQSEDEKIRIKQLKRMIEEQKKIEEYIKNQKKKWKH